MTLIEIQWLHNWLAFPMIWLSTTPTTTAASDFKFNLGTDFLYLQNKIKFFLALEEFSISEIPSSA